MYHANDIIKISVYLHLYIGIICNPESSWPKVFYKMVILKNLAKFTGKHLCQSLFPKLSSSVIWQKGESWNGGNKNAKHTKFSDFPASGLLQIGHKLKKWQWRHNFPTWHHRQIFFMLFVSLVKFIYWSNFHVIIITGSGVMAIFFIRDWLEIRKSEISPFAFCPISGDWSKLEIPKLAWMFLIKCY